MFQKPTFGSTSATFGSFNTTPTTSSPFGGFKPQAPTGAFGGAPAFGAAATPQPAQTGSFFGSTPATGGIFGSTTAASTPSTFGASTSGGFGFGAQNTTGGLFGAQNTTTGMFGAAQTQNTSFGAKPAGFGFGATAAPAATGGLFGATPTPAAGLFPQQQTTSMTGGTLFGNTAGGFGQQPAAAGTAHVKYNPVVGTDVMVKSGTSQNINIKHHCITCMKEYENKSLEELRLEDYVCGNKGATNVASGGLFAANKPMFPANSAFGQPATSVAQTSSVFGGGALGTAGFGQGNLGQTNAFSFGGNTAQANTTSNLFGVSKPAFGVTASPGTTNLFSATTTQAPAFGTNTSSFGFANNTQQQSGGIFGAKPAAPAFGATGAATGFGAFGGGGGLFAAKPAQSAAPAFPAASAFGTTTPAFGTTTSTAGGIFNNFKTPAQTGFGFGNTTQTNTMGGLGTGLGASFQSKPGGFPALAAPSGLFAAHAQPQLSFNTGTGNGAGTLGSGLGFGSALGSTLGSLGTLGALGPGAAPALNTTVGSAAGGNVHEQILNLAARPYGDWPLFKDLVPDTATSADESISATNPAAVKAALAGSAYRITSPDVTSLTVHCRPLQHQAKKSLFDGLEESDASLEDKLSLKPSRKRLVLRPQQHRAAGVRATDDRDRDHDAHDHSNRSIEGTDKPNRPDSNANRSEEYNASADLSKDGPRRFEDHSRGVNTDLEDSSERHNSWLGSSKLPWNDSKEKPIDNQPSPRLYPDLERETASQAGERRSSWLTTKPLRKKVPDEYAHAHAHDAQDSVRELRTDTTRTVAHDKENVETSNVSEEEQVSTRPTPAHPAGVRLTRPGYYTVPSLDDMISYIRPDGRCVVPHLTIGRKNYGNVYYDCEIDVTGLDLDALVHFLNKEVIVYPSDADKPPVGTELNRRAIVTLDRVWPRDKTERRPVTDPDRLLKMEYEAKLRRVCDKHDTKFIEYRPQTGSWVFRVEHFSKYGLTDSDEEDDIAPEILKRQLVNQTLQKNAAPVAAQIPLPPVPAGLGGLMAPEDSLFAMQQSSLNLLSNAGKAFEMDTTEDSPEGQSMYPDINRAFGVKSPTSELARLENRHSHSVQLMKASLYADTEMEDDNMSASTGDQLVPQPTSLLSLSRAASAAPETPDDVQHTKLLMSPEPITEELPAKPLFVQPHTIVLKYHRKIPPFKHTIAGELDASTIADMSVSRARHSRVGFGPGNTLVFVATAHNMDNIPQAAELSELSRYVRGRSERDWSDQRVVRLRVGDVDATSSVVTAVSGHLDAVLDFSTSSEGGGEDGPPPLLTVRGSSAERRALLDRHLAEADKDRRQPKFGVSGAYCREIWKLCDALWGADLDNGGVPGTDEQSIVNRHKAFLEWLTAAVSDVTDADLAQPTSSEKEDESDGHSARVLSLVLGGRVAEACRAARQAGDYNMAALIAQSPGDHTVRTLVTRQLASWRACGADTLVVAPRVTCLQLISAAACAGHRAWTVLLHQVARYLCPQVPSLEQVVRKYEGLFRRELEDDDAETDLTLVTEEDSAETPYPLPPYQAEYDISVHNNGKRRRVLDLRYELIRARALNCRPRLRPAASTPDPLDYHLCFLLGAWTGNLEAETITSFADQLEAAGAWHRAVQALCYLPGDAARAHLIRGVISRHMPAHCAADDEKLKLLARLRIPESYKALAIAHRAKYQHEPRLEAENLLIARQWSATHRVLLEELMPTTVLADDMESIAPLLEQMYSAATRHRISGWERGGLALYHYLHVCAEIRELVTAVEADRSRGSLQTRLETLRPRVAAACRALGSLETKTAAQAAARAEMGARLVQSALAGGSPAAHLVALLAALRLPPDCAAHALHKMTTELADQASEACLETAGASAYPLRLSEAQS